ncbi:MAG: Hsp20/alpha crystallin family protein [Flavobacterium sp.]
MNVVKQNRNAFPMDELFRDILGGTQYLNRTIPPVNINEGDTAFTIQLLAPGFKKEDFTLEVDNDVLEISANLAETEEITGKFTRREFKATPFKRTFKLPQTVNQEAIGAGYEGGVLSISLPKKEEAQPKEKRAITIS